MLNRAPHRAQAQVHRFFGLQPVAQAQRRRGGRIGRQLDVGRRRSDVGRGIKFFGEGRRAETVADGAAQREFRREIVTRRQLADGGIAEIAVMLVASRGIDPQIVDGFGGEIDVAGIVLAVIGSGIERRQAREGLRAAVHPRYGNAGADRVGLAPIFAAEGDVQGSCQTDVEVALQIDVRHPLRGLQSTVVEIAGLRYAIRSIHAGIDRADRRNSHASPP